MVRCVECGSSRFDEMGIGCALCGKALGPRWEGCWISEITKTRLLSHSVELGRFGIALEECEPLRKNADAVLAVAALVLSVADSLDHGVLQKLVSYLHSELSIPRDEILRLRLAEPEEVDEVLVNEQKARIRRIAGDEFPDHMVVFDESPESAVRFRVQHRDGTIRTHAHPHWSLPELEAVSDEQLRSLIRELCGFAPDRPRQFSE